MDTQTRVLKHADIPAYRDLRLHALKESPLSFSDSFEDEEHKPLEYFGAFIGDDEEHMTLGSFEKEKLVGFATFKRDKRTKARHKSYIHTMYVSPDCRGKGIAHTILQQLTTHASSLPALEQIHVWVLRPETSPAKKLYLKSGFVSQGLVRDDLKINGTYVDAEYMTLRL